MKICEVCKIRRRNAAFPVVMPGLFGFKDLRSKTCRACLNSQGKDPNEELIRNLDSLIADTVEKVKEVIK